MLVTLYNCYYLVKVKNIKIINQPFEVQLITTKGLKKSELT